VSEVGVSCRHVNRDRLRALMADGDVLLSPTVARGCGIARSGRACGARAGRGARGARCCTCGGSRRTRGARARG
jgi:hypothetical protein